MASAVVGGVILGLIEGIGILISRINGQMMMTEQSMLKLKIFLK